MFAEDAGGKRWLVKNYGGNENRVATEALANAVYREVGADVPAAGVGVRNGKKVLTYPTVDGEVRPHTFRVNGPSSRVGRHFMVDALVANHDVAGLEDDNVLWQPHPTKKGVERPVRLDQGGTFEYRAMGDPKPYGPVPEEVVSMRAKPTRQGARSSKVTEAGLKEQAREIAEKLTDKRIDELVDAAGFGDRQMRERIRTNLKARVKWMRDYAAGKVRVQVPALAEAEVMRTCPHNETSWLDRLEEAALPHKWEEALHPRDAHGKFIDKVGGLKLGESLALDSKTALKKDKDGTFRVTRSGQIIKGFRTPDDAVRAALDRSAKSKEPDSVGGATSHKDFNAYLSTRLKAKELDTGKQATLVKGVYTHPVGDNNVAFGGRFYSPEEASAKLKTLRANLSMMRHDAEGDKYVQRAVPTVEAREKELAAKVKNAGGQHNIGNEFTGTGGHGAALAHLVNVSGQPDPKGEPAVTVGAGVPKAPNAPAAPADPVTPGTKFTVHGAGNYHVAKVEGDKVTIGWDAKTGGGSAGQSDTYTVADIKQNFAGGKWKATGHDPSLAATGHKTKATKAGPKISGKQENALGPGGGGAPASQLDLAPGDKIQYKKGGWTYEVLQPQGDGIPMKVKGPNGQVKVYSGYKPPAFVQKADKSKLKLKPTPTAGAAQSSAHPPQSPPEVYVKSLKNGLGLLGANESPLSVKSQVVFQTPSGKILYKDPSGTITNLETGATVNVASTVVPPKASDLEAHLSLARAARDAHKAKAVKPPEPPKPDDAWKGLPTGAVADSKLLSAQGGSGGSKITGSERSAVEFYTGSGYRPMNKQLREVRGIGSKSTEKQIAAMDSAVRGHELPEDMVLWRGVCGQTGQKYNAETKVGDVIRDNGFISMSTSESFAHSWTDASLVMKVRMPKGTKGIYAGPGTGLSHHLSEKEYIVNHGVGFEVIRVYQENGNKVIVVEPTVGHL